MQPRKTFAEFKLVALEGSEVVKGSVCTQSDAAALDSWKSEYKTAFEEKDLEMKATCGVRGGKKKKKEKFWLFDLSLKRDVCVCVCVVSHIPTP